MDKIVALTPTLQYHRKIVLLGPGNSIHIQRWANSLTDRGLKVHLITAHETLKEIDPNVTVHRLKLSAPWAYLAAQSEVKKFINLIKPDILNAHYATGYGLLARNVRFQPTLLSIWGSDVYDFPEKSIFHKWLVRSNLQSANAIASTSECMAQKTSSICKTKKIHITPFGVDETIFRPSLIKKESNKITIGTVKSLSKKYGIDTLIRAFALATKQLGTAFNLHLEITGGGQDEAKLKKLVARLGIAPAVTFHGSVPHESVPDMLARLDIFVALSRDESFGVAAVEAAACGLPVVVSDAAGLAEVTVHEKTGFVVPRNDHHAAASALVRLITDANLREEFGRAGQQHVLLNYTWEKSLDKMIEVYQAVANEHLRAPIVSQCQHEHPLP